jgi:hypothetical protein
MAEMRVRRSRCNNASTGDFRRSSGFDMRFHKANRASVLFRLRALGLFLICAAMIAAQGALNTLSSQEKPDPVPHRVFLVSDPGAKGAVEVSVAINPTNPDHMVAVSIQATKKDDPVTNYAYVTTDGGTTWKTIPYDNPLKRQQGDDVVTFTADGLAVRAYINFVGIRNPRPARAGNGIWIGTSRDGLSWDPPVAVVDHVNSVEPFEDKPWIKADVSGDSRHKGNLYICWTEFDVYGSKKPEHKTHIFVSRSLDGGKSFSVPLRVSESPGDCEDKSKTLMGAVPAVGPLGEVYAIWGGPKGLIMAKSTDAGHTFGKNRTIVESPTGDGDGGWEFPIKGLGRANGSPSAGVDITSGKDRGSIYVTWADIRNGDPDVFLTISRDGGATWTAPIRIGDDAVGNGKEQWFPWLVVDPVDGSINIAYYDRGPHDGTSTSVTLARSVDGGRTFRYHRINQEPFDLTPKMGFFGDYLGIDAFGGRVAVLFMRSYDAKRLGISGAVFDFAPGTQEPRMEKKSDKR